MNSIGLQRVKTEETANNRLNKHQIQFHYQNRGRTLRKASFSNSSSKPPKQHSPLIRISTHSKSTTKPIKKYSLDSATDVFLPSPQKKALQVKNIEFPPVGNNTEDYISSSQSTKQCKSRRKTQKLARVIKDCQKLVEIMKNCKEQGEDHLFSPDKNLQEVSVRNILLPSGPRGKVDILRSEEERLSELKKQVKQFHIFEAKRFDPRQSFFIVSSSNNGNK